MYKIVHFVGSYYIRYVYHNARYKKRKVCVDGSVEKCDIMLGPPESIWCVTCEKSLQPTAHRMERLGSQNSGNTKNVSYNFRLFAYLSASPLPNTNHTPYISSSLPGNFVTPNVYFSLCVIFLCHSKVQYSLQSALRQVPSFFQSEFFTECHLVFSVSISIILSFP